MLAIAMCLTTAVSAFVSCGSTKNSGSETTKEKGKTVIGLSMNTLNNPFFVDVKKGSSEKQQQMITE